jgi:PPM family protein phosphatase
LQVTCVTNQGLERSRNEDSCYAVSSSGSALLVVADGMGGHRAGNVASSIVVAEAEKTWSKLNPGCLSPGPESHIIIKELISEVNSKILEAASRDSSLRGMGTTVTAGLLCGRQLTIGHVGDSRAYKINNSSITLLTKDHSLVEKLVETGQVKAEDACSHPQRHILTRALGIAAVLEIDMVEQEIERDSVLVLCTDGLTNMVRDHEILSVVESNIKDNPQNIAEALIKLANDRGGFDNITVVVATGIGGRLT